MSGAACGYMLSRSGIPAVLIDQGRIASGSTLANTGLLQYSNDLTLTDMAEQLGEADAVSFYRACKHAAERLADIAENLNRDVQFKRRCSLYYTTTPDDLDMLRREYEMLHTHGFDAEWWDESKIKAHFPFSRAGAIVTRGDAEVNPFRFVHAMAEDACQHGLRIYENTSMLSVEPSATGYRVVTQQGQIETEHVIYATGYVPETAGGRWIRPKLTRSYVIVTDPIDSLSEWHERFMLWETARPYLYIRTTHDNRIVAGGLDEDLREPLLSEDHLHNRSMRLLADLHALFPSFSPQIRYQWCATFGESADGLPWLGEDPDRRNQHYCLGYGGNGTIYSMLGAHIIRDRLLGVDNPAAALVRPDRLKLGALS
ncbi:NAD(P)/FAD-dependent oxidoreductase [Cohnella kolymensis]|uniref:NAD(P)/FAD-dependent oxidoreductase n=1 Tax=Cohnella kolymensis TaxID=1590652 RepID=UPI0006987B6D|nr:FAD-dependent oxidoreductase [Cohnella kolymensis]